MEAQKSSLGRSPSVLSVKKAFRRFEDVKAEFFRIEWTEEGEVSAIAKVVVLATFICGMILCFADLAVQRMLMGFEAVLRMIFG